MNAFGMGTVVVQALGWCLLHFLWQAAAVGVVYAVLRVALPRGKPRYVAAMTALVVLAVMPGWTFWHEAQVLARPVDLGNVLVGSAGLPLAAGAARAAGGWLALLRSSLPWLVLAWGCGVAFLGLRVMRQWRGLRAIVQAAEALPAWQARAQQFGRHMGCARVVRVLGSMRIATPTLVGWIRPVVVMPVAMLAGMPAEQVDLILAHELAHLRRFDHLANLFQIVLETLFFYHPVVHWISRDARNERELCCDALALQASGGKRRDFVAALAGLAEFRSDQAALALAASGGVLVERAWFIAGATPAHLPPRRSLSVVLLALLCAVIVAGLAWQQEVARARVDSVLAANAAALRDKLVALVEPLPVRVWHGAIGQPPRLAPVAPAAIENLLPTGVAVPASRLPRVSVPTLAVPNLAVVAMPIALALGHRDVVPASGSVVPATADVPHTLRVVQPVYPPQALLSGAQGQVEIQFALSAAGVPQDLQVVRSSASGRFDEAALSALSRWRFAPPAAPGKQYRQTFTFRLDTAAGGHATPARSCLVVTGTHICRRAAGADVRMRRLNR